MNKKNLFFVLFYVFVQIDSSWAQHQKPNVIFIIVDDLNHWIEPLKAHSQVKTPNLNKLARMSVSFTNAHCALPLCSPSRASIITGLHPSQTGYFGHDQNAAKHSWKNNPVINNSKTMIEHFAENGYITMGVGKINHNEKYVNEQFKSDLDINNKRELITDYGPWPFDGVAKRLHSDFYPQLPLSSHEFTSFGYFENVPYFPADPLNSVPGFKGWRKNWDCSIPFRVMEDGKLLDPAPDEEYAQWAVEKLGQNFNKPFFMWIGFIRPHTPMYAPKRFFDMYPLDKVDMSYYKEEDLSDCAELMKKAHNEEKMKAFFGSKEMALKKWSQAYLASVSFVDEQIGKIIDAFEKSKYKENTILVLTSDHGFHNGDKERFSKVTLWEPSTKVPLFVYAPGYQQGAECQNPVSLVDIFPTLNDLCSLSNDPNKGMSQMALSGYSLKRFLKRPSKKSKKNPEYALTAIFTDNKIIGNDALQQPNELQSWAIRTHRYRYIKYFNGDEEFYHTEKDMYEFKNLIRDPSLQPIINKHRKMLKKALTGKK